MLPVGTTSLFGLENLTAFGSRHGALRGALEVALVSLLAVQAARLFWILAAPAIALTPPPSDEARITDSQLASLTRFNPFAPRHPNQSGAAANNLAMSLYGVRTGGKDGGSAIIAVSGAAQAVFGIGEEVQPGTVLKSIAADHVELMSRNGTINLPLMAASTASGASSVPSYLVTPVKVQAAPKPPAIAVDPKKFLEETGLRPRTENGRVTGYTVLPRGEAETLKRAGLEAGDVLVGLNGGEISPERYAELEYELSQPEVQLTVQRGSETKTITLQTGR